MTEYLRDQRGILDTGDDLQPAAAFRTGLDVDGKHSLEDHQSQLSFRAKMAVKGRNRLKSPRVSRVPFVGALRK